jgi:hypothetical protein
MSLKDEMDIANFITEQIKIEFTGGQFKLNTWGQVDKWVELKKDIFFFVEIETKQKHPSTNVLKVWPYLEENSNAKIFLIQTYFPNSSGVNSNRGRMGEWIAAKIKATFPKRFDYHKLVIDGKDDRKELQDILRRINLF